MAHRFEQIFYEAVLNTLGKSVRFCHRVREITPYRLALGLMEVFATLRVETIADAHRAFNASCDTAVPVFMRSLCEHLMTRLTSKVLRFSAGSPFARFTHITRRILLASRRPVRRREVPLSP